MEREKYQPLTWISNAMEQVAFQCHKNKTNPKFSALFFYSSTDEYIMRGPPQIAWWTPKIMDAKN